MALVDKICAVPVVWKDPTNAMVSVNTRDREIRTCKSETVLLRSTSPPPDKTKQLTITQTPDLLDEALAIQSEEVHRALRVQEERRTPGVRRGPRSSSPQGALKQMAALQLTWKATSDSSSKLNSEISRIITTVNKDEHH